jgi:hypothetical protein
MTRKEAILFIASSIEENQGEYGSRTQADVDKILEALRALGVEDSEIPTLTA